MTRIIVIGASAGGVEALRELVGKLPPELDAALFVVLHVAPTSRGFLAEILSDAGPLEALQVKRRMRIRRSAIHVAPPNKHLMIEDGFVKLSAGPRENRFRPSIDVLFRSAAESYGPSVVGILLSGNLDDGVAGLNRIKHFGGTVWVQDPNEAGFPNLPLNAIRGDSIDVVLTVSEMAPRIFASVEEARQMERSEIESNQADHDLDDIGTRSVWKCPECGGLLWEIDEDNLARFQCHVGHRFSELSLFRAEVENAEEALWTALRALKEKASLARRLAEKSAEIGDLTANLNFIQHAEEAESAISTLNGLLYSGIREEEESYELEE